MPQQEIVEVIPEPVCPFWNDGKHLWSEEKSHGNVVAKSCACEAVIKARQTT